MKIRNATSVLAVAAVLLCGAGSAFAKDAISAPAEKKIGSPTNAKAEIVPSLIVMTSDGASLDGTTLTLSGISTNAIMFADRPVRSAGHALTAHLLEEWDAGKKGGFASDPPNATVSVFSKDASTVADAVVVLKDPKMSGGNLTFNVEVLEGDLKGADGPASVFIDIIGLPRTPLSFAGAARRTAYRGAWYGGAAVAGAAIAGAAVGAAVAAPYYGYHPYYAPPPPACGYYPYPPCY